MFRLLFVFLQMHCGCCQCWKVNGWRKKGCGADIMDIGVFWRLGFDSVRISQIQTVGQKQGNGDAPWDVYRQPVLYMDGSGTVSWRMGITITFCVGLSALLVSTDWAMREPLHCGTGNRTGSTFFMLLGVEPITNPQPSGSLAAQLIWCNDHSGIR